MFKQASSSALATSPAACRISSARWPSSMASNNRNCILYTAARPNRTTPRKHPAGSPRASARPHACSASRYRVIAVSYRPRAECTLPSAIRHSIRPTLSEGVDVRNRSARSSRACADSYSPSVRSNSARLCKVSAQSLYATGLCTFQNASASSNAWRASTGRSHFARQMPSAVRARYLAGSPRNNRFSRSSHKRWAASHASGHAPSLT